MLHMSSRALCEHRPSSRALRSSATTRVALNTRITRSASSFWGNANGMTLACSSSIHFAVREESGVRSTTVCPPTASPRPLRPAICARRPAWNTAVSVSHTLCTVMPSAITVVATISTGPSRAAWSAAPSPASEVPSFPPWTANTLPRRRNKKEKCCITSASELLLATTRSTDPHVLVVPSVTDSSPSRKKRGKRMRISRSMAGPRSSPPPTSATFTVCCTRRRTGATVVVVVVVVDVDVDVDVDVLLRWAASVRMMSALSMSSTPNAPSVTFARPGRKVPMTATNTGK